ncbi:uncharacterized protein SPPG_09190 [Spizellomyces punctatus DAOM BR117]|uniref:Uncharacterized protein n=1 Tax=Spizellomyces punctatus (strain DAOM BR117) TaxID=645134 RepID=A0A0L0HGY1_SPIPD|nr:uncharacterized protein SPPG_09190 [Spizellomyces punctatus DAOM BR117]KND00059.1 hypothetical protein SPPG_09190 [Spizellomyces punctatus DAOM BR117]|eukprot:XP_016608098.1 hypothetical protein SPPG_09190 [Spizellomyces punctatus DAOM BR117]
MHFIRTCLFALLSFLISVIPVCQAQQPCDTSKLLSCPLPLVCVPVPIVCVQAPCPASVGRCTPWAEAGLPKTITLITPGSSRPSPTDNTKPGETLTFPTAMPTAILPSGSPSASTTRDASGEAPTTTSRGRPLVTAVVESGVKRYEAPVNMFMAAILGTLLLMGVPRQIIM